MKLKAKLGGVAAMLTVGVFYTFALCMVEDVDASSISAEYYYPDGSDNVSPEDAPRHDTEITVTAAETQAAVPEETTEKVSETEAETVTEPEAQTQTEKTKKEEKRKTEPAEPKASKAETASAQTEDSSAGANAEVNAEISEKELYGAGISESAAAEDDVPEEDNEELDDISDISDVTDNSEAYTEETETVTETEFTPFADDDEDFMALFTSAPAETTAETTAVSVDVPAGGNIYTSETFTAKFNGSTQTVNAYDLICQIVNNEMSPSFSDEAIKAQAVAAYSYVKYHNVNGLTPSVLVKKNPSDRIKNLVSEVWGVCCYYNGSVAQTVYMASSSGYTADAEHVWGGSVPYLKSVYCPFDVGNDPNYGSTMKVSESSMRNMLESSLGISLSNNPYGWLNIQSYVDGNYVYEISVDGQKTISGRKLRETVMGHKLKSAAFDVSYRDGEFIFTTYGYGHGVGMSQNGANILAKQGYTYYDILKYYFTGIEII